MQIAQTPHERLAEMLDVLKLTAIRDQLDRLLGEAARQELTLADALAMLCERELGRRHERRIEMGLSIAKFPAVRELSAFDYKAQPPLDSKQINELATGRWIGLGETLGPPGVGKTHLAIGLGRAAVSVGYSVLFTQATTLVGAMQADDMKRLKQFEVENARLKKLLAERDLEIEIMKEIAIKKW
jgi:DNA replication protein DnaC